MPKKRPSQPDTSNPRRCDLLASVADLYYNAKLDQEEVALRIGVSRSTVSRMLNEAQDAGIVQIRINWSLPHNEILEQETVRAFDIREALILDGATLRTNEVLGRVGRLTAQYLDATLSEGCTLAISWGTAILAVADGWEPTQRKNIDIIQMIGGAGSSHPEVDGTELARRLADILGGTYQYLNAPLVVDDQAVATALLRQSSISMVLDAASRADTALVGIGSLDPDVSSLLRAGYLTRDGIVSARKSGAVGDVCGHHIDAAGGLLALDLDRRTIGISVEALRKIPRVIGIAVGNVKAAAILAALRSGLLNVIATDSATMHAVLELNAKLTHSRSYLELSRS